MTTYRIWFYDEGTDEGGYLQTTHPSAEAAKAEAQRVNDELADQAEGVEREALKWDSERGLESADISYQFAPTGEGNASYTIIPME